MQSLRRIAICVTLLAAPVAGSQVLADQLAPPPQPSSIDTPAGRWIRKTPPTAPLPDIPAAPLPPSDPALVSAPDPVLAPAAIDGPAAGSGMALAELEEIALANNPTLLQAAMRIDAARGKCLQAGLYPNPVVGYQADEIGMQGSAGQQGAFLAQQIVTAGKLQLRTAVVAREIEQAEYTFLAQRRRVLNDVRRAWYEVLVGQRIVELNGKLVHVAGQGIEAAEELMADLGGGGADVLQFKIEADSANLQLYDARNRHRAAWRRLAALLGVPEMEPSPLAGDLEGDLPELAWEQSLARLLAESPELARAQAGVQRARAAVVRENAEWVPNVDLEAGVRYHDAFHETVASIEVGLPLPLFNRNQGNICRAQAELIAAENEVQRTELALRRRLATAFQRYDNEAGKYATSILRNAQDSLEQVRAGLKQGKFDYLTLLTAQRTYFRVNLAYLEALLELRASGVAIDGLLLEGGLDQTANAQ